MLKRDELASKLVDLIKCGPRLNVTQMIETVNAAPDSDALTILKLSIMAYDFVQRGVLVEKE